MIDRLRGAALWAGAALGLLAVAVAVAVAFFGYGFLIFRSGSMSPGIPTGSLALEHTIPASAIRVGDVISVPISNGARVTHRVVSVHLDGGTADLILKGDANGTPDDVTYHVTHAEREIASVPRAGYVASYLLSPSGLVVLACAAGVVVILCWGSDRDRDERPKPPGSSSSHRRSGDGGGRHRLPAGAAITAVVVVATAITGTGAYLKDTATATTGLFTAATLVPPTGVVCTGSNPNATISWTPPASGATPSSYRISYTYNGGSGTDTVTGATTYRPPSAGIISQRTYTVTVASGQGTNWTSTLSTSSAKITVTMIIGNPTFACA